MISGLIFMGEILFIAITSVNPRIHCG